MKPKLHKCYNANFYEKQAEGSYQSAKVILGILFKSIKVRSIVDVGCGVGTWLRAAKELGCKECLGIEGDWVVNEIRQKNGIKIKTQNLENKIQVSKKYDLAISMEVAEHLNPQRAESFIRDLCRCSDIVLFSAAVPGQGGINHLNERPISFWGKIFLDHQYIPFDILRPLLVKNLNLQTWYRCNTILYISCKKIFEILQSNETLFLDTLDRSPPKSVRTAFQLLKDSSILFCYFIRKSISARCGRWV